MPTTIHTSYTNPANGTAGILTYLNLLLTYGWTCPAYSDGTTYYSAGPYATPFPSGSGAGANCLGNNNAWFRVQVGAGATLREWMFQRSTTDPVWAVWRSKLGFTGGSPSATVLPTDATSGQNVWSSAAFFDASPGDQFVSTNTLDNSWTLFTIPAGGGNMKTFMCDESLAANTYPATDGDPYLYSAFYYSYGFTANGAGCFLPYETSTPIAIYKRYRHGLTSPSNVQVAYNTMFSVGSFTVAPPSNNTTQQAGPDPINTQEWPLFIPVSHYGASGTGVGWCGYTNGQRWASVVGRANGQTENCTTVFYIYCAGLWVPWDSSAPSL